MYRILLHLQKSIPYRNCRVLKRFCKSGDFLATIRVKNARR
jgi:hypothetical protein